MLRQFRADVHIHTCLSPCADLDMSPRAIVRRAKEIGLDIIGITDHNSSENVVVTKDLGNEAGILVIPGMEVTSQEEVHVLVFFDKIDEALIFQGDIYNHLPDKENNEETFGFQPIVNRDDEVLYFNKRLLIGATDLSLETLIQRVHSLQGIAIASHVDRASFSVVSQLGIIPPDCPFDAVEISSQIFLQKAWNKIPDITKFPIVTASDAHFLKDIGRSSTSFFIEQPDFREFTMALRQEGGRKISI